MKPILAGLIFGAIDVCLMLPLPFADKRIGISCGVL
jgi:hypothetical protein